MPDSASQEYLRALGEPDGKAAQGGQVLEEDRGEQVITPTVLGTFCIRLATVAGINSL